MRMRTTKEQLDVAKVIYFMGKIQLLSSNKRVQVRLGYCLFCCCCCLKASVAFPHIIAKNMSRAKLFTFYNIHTEHHIISLVLSFEDSTAMFYDLKKQAEKD